MCRYSDLTKNVISRSPLRVQGWTVTMVPNRDRTIIRTSHQKLLINVIFNWMVSLDLTTIIPACPSQTRHPWPVHFSPLRSYALVIYFSVSCDNAGRVSCFRSSVKQGECEPARLDPPKTPCQLESEQPPLTKTNGSPVTGILRCFARSNLGGTAWETSRPRARVFLF